MALAESYALADAAGTPQKDRVQFTRTVSGNNGQSVNDFINKYRHSFVVYGSACKDLKAAMDKLKSHGFHTMDRVSAKNNRYLIAATDNADGARTLSSLGPTFKHRAYLSDNQNPVAKKAQAGLSE